MVGVRDGFEIGFRDQGLVLAHMIRSGFRVGFSDWLGFKDEVGVGVRLWDGGWD